VFLSSLAKLPVYIYNLYILKKIHTQNSKTMFKPNFRKKIFSAVIAIAALQTTQAQSISECLVAAYNFNQQNVNDNIGTSNGTAVGATPVTDRFGNPNGAWYLAGNPQSYLNLGTYNTLKPLTGSLSLWFKLDTAVVTGSGFSYNPIIHTKGQQGNNCYESYAVYYNYLNQTVFGFTTQFPCNQPVAYGPVVTAHAWHNVVYTYDSNMIRIYYDGVKKDSAATGFQPVFLASDSVMVGTSANLQNDRQFNGAVDDIRFYNCVVTQRQVTALYNETETPVYTGIRQTTANAASIYLNKDNALNVYCPGSDACLVEITDLLGHTILRSQCNQSTSVISLPESATGVLLVKVTCKDSYTVKKIIVSK
jgi:hypothetical protein